MSLEKSSPLPISLFNLLQQRLGRHLSSVRCTKATLVHLSHTLEDLVLSQCIPAMIFTGFQESAHWRQERERYRALAQVAQQVYIFAGAPLPPENEANSLHVILNENDALYQEWFLAIISESFAVILCGQDSQVNTPDEATRQFDSLWSFDPALVNEVLDLLSEVIAAYRPERLAQFRAACASFPVIKLDPALITDFAMQMVRFEETLHQRYRQSETALRQYQEQLEEQVADRTAALTEANRQLQREIHERQQAEAEIQRYRDHLEDLVIERTAELRTANRQLQQEIIVRQQAEAERARLLAAEHDQRLLAETLREVTLALTSQTNHTAVLNEVLRQARRIVQYNTANISLIQDDRMHVAFWQGYEAFDSEKFVANLIQPLADYPLERSAVQSQRPVVIHDTRQEPDWVLLEKTAWIKSYLIVPICLHDQVLGLLRLGADRPGQFSAEDAQRLQALANAAAVALENARLHAETQAQLQAQTALREAWMVISSTLDLTTVLNHIVQQIGRVVDASSAYLCSYEAETMTSTVLAEYFSPHAVERERVSDLGVTYNLPRDFSQTFDLLQAGQPEQIYLDEPEMSGSKQSHMHQFGAQTILNIPLQIGGQVIAFAELWESQRRREFTPEEVGLCQSIAQQAAVAIRNAQLYAETQRHLKEQTALREAGAAISSTLDLTAVLSLIAEQMGRVVDVTSAYIVGYEPEAMTITVLAEYISSQASAQERISDLGVTYHLPTVFPGVITFLQAGQPRLQHPDDLDLIASEQNHLRQYEAQTVLDIPLKVAGQIIAYASLWETRRRREFTSDEIALCQTIAQQAAVAIEKARLYDQTQKQARQMEQILHAMRAGVLLLDSDHRVKIANKAGQDYLPVLAGVEVGQIMTRLGEQHLEELLMALPDGQWHEVTPVGLSQPIFHVYARPLIAEPAETEGWMMVMRDITEERDIQTRMQQQEKLAAVGQLAAGIAHDFNNILTSIIGFAELARVTPDVPASVIDDLDHIVQQGQRAARLVRQILDFARKNITARRPVDLSRFLEEMVDLLKRTIPENIRLELNIEPSRKTYFLNADPTQLQQALTNLAINAADAMPLGGVLQFNLSHFTLAVNQRPPSPEMAPGDWLALAVTDTGVGMSPEVQLHLFEPFFTTKEVGQGTGLGLAQVEGIVKQHEGYIKVKSKTGYGATFSLYFPPLSTPQPAKLPEISTDERKVPGQDKVILLVEDNKFVLEVVEAMLKNLGYQVLTATNGRSAVEIYDQYQDNIALVVTDLTMPEMSGFTLAKTLRAKNRAVKILAITGYPLKMGTEELLAQGIAGWLQKPLSLEQLAQKLEQIL